MIPTGCKNLDLLLNGGLTESVITQIYGSYGTGKTNIALTTAFNAVKLNKKVIFIDTEGSFHEQRVKQIFGSDKNLLKNITLIDVSNFQEIKVYGY